MWKNKKVTSQIDNHDVVLRVLGDAQRSIGSLMHLCIENIVECFMFSFVMSDKIVIAAVALSIFQ